MAGEDAAVEVARRVCDALRPPLRVDGERVVLGASIGVVVAEEGAGTDDLLRVADAALYRAKEGGKGRVGGPRRPWPRRTRASSRGGPCAAPSTPAS